MSTAKPSALCARCCDYADGGLLYRTRTGQYRHLSTGRVRCPGQEDDDTDDNATATAFDSYIRWPRVLLEALSEFTRQRRSVEQAAAFALAHPDLRDLYARQWDPGPADGQRALELLLAALRRTPRVTEPARALARLHRRSEPDLERLAESVPVTATTSVSLSAGSVLAVERARRVRVLP